MHHLNVGPLSMSVGSTAEDSISQSSQRLADAFLAALPRVGVALVLVLVGWGLARLLRWALQRSLARNHTVSFAAVMSKLAGWILVTAAVLAAATVAFPSVKPVDLLAGLGFFSLAVGFAFQDILENTLSGVLMLFRQPFASGDQIEVLEHRGTVEAITIRETRLKTYDGQLILIPNRDVYKNPITVQTHFPQRRLAFVVGIAYENDAEEACRVIQGALAEVDGVGTAPPPEALINLLGVSTVDVEARFWTEPQQHHARQVLHRAIAAVKTALDGAGIEMPAEIVALQATPSFQAALRGDAEITPGGGLKVARPDPRGPIEEPGASR